ncbi:MAG TPA: barstar family protein [Vicinamibacterales bacterium]|nr:barstar family protein [Vicinamibacterales bacterium]
MTELELDARGWQSAEDVWNGVLKALGAPAWHGHNLDALNDSITGGDLNTVNAPFRVRLSGLEEATAVARVVAWRMGRLVIDLATEGVQVDWSPVAEGAAAEAVAALDAFRHAALEKERRIRAGDDSGDAALHTKMAENLRLLFGLGAAGSDCIEALLRDDRSQVAAWVAAELAARREKRGADVLQSIARLPGPEGFAARVTLDELHRGRLQSPFGLTSA